VRIASVYRTEVQHHSTHHHLYKFWVVRAFSARISLNKDKNFTSFISNYAFWVLIRTFFEVLFSNPHFKHPYFSSQFIFANPVFKSIFYVKK